MGEGIAMPGLTTIKILGNLKFFGGGLQLPNTDWKKGSDAKMYSDAFKPADKVAIPSVIPPWFKPAEVPNKYYQDTCDKIGQGFKELHDNMIDAVAYSHQMWKLQAKFQ